MFRSLTTTVLFGATLAIAAHSAAHAQTGLRQTPPQSGVPLGHHGGAGGPGSVAANMEGQVGVGLPSRLNVNVFMRHNDTGLPYKLDNMNGNTKVNAQFSLTCPAGKYVVSIAYTQTGGIVNEVYAYNGVFQQNSVAFSAQVEPLLTEQYEIAGAYVLEDAWNPHYAEYTAQQATKTIKDPFEVVSRCSGQSAKSQNFLVTYHFFVKDLDYVAQIGQGPASSLGAAQPAQGVPAVPAQQGRLKRR